MTNSTRDDRAILDQLINHTADCDLADPFRADDDHDTALTDLRILMINLDATDYSAIDYCQSPNRYIIRDCLNSLFNSDLDSDRSYISELALSLSLCPMHLIDYAICFDDDNPDCRTIRDIFPNHDT